MSESRKANFSQKQQGVQPKVQQEPIQRKIKSINTPKIIQKPLAERLGEKPKKIEERLGKTIFERLGDKLPRGTIVIGANRILGPKPSLIGKRNSYRRKMDGSLRTSFRNS